MCIYEYSPAALKRNAVVDCCLHLHNAILIYKLACTVFIVLPIWLVIGDTKLGFLFLYPHSSLYITYAH